VDADQLGDNSVPLERRFLIFLGAVLVYLPLLLLTDSPGLLPQLALGAATAAFLWLFVRRGAIEPRQVITAIIVATAGEVFLSLGWGLYTYHNALIPLYVPFGHGIFYALAAESARQNALRRIAPAITRSVIAAGSIIAIVSLIFFRDQWGFLWWIIAATLVMRSRNQLLLSTCFVYTILLEWGGTAIGNWLWAPDVPFVGLTSANPPSGVGVLYILLDLITVAICTSLPSRSVEEAPLDATA
jgi:hypothetical protein